MLGAYRFFLAWMVVAQHSGGAQGAGGFAVFAFFVLSGYLMTHIMHGTYGYTAGGLAKFSANRLLRIYPLYWLASALAFVVALASSAETMARIGGGMGIPTSAEHLLANALILVSQETCPLLIPPAWTLAVELLFYLLIGLGISRTATGTVLWFGLGVVYAAAAHVMKLGGDFTYFSPLAASLPFSVGALVFHFQGGFDKLPSVLRSPFGCLGLVLMQLLLWWVSQALGEVVRYEIFLYASIALNALTLAALLRLKPGAVLNAKRDAGLGKLSYPIYLTHTAITVLVADLLSFEHASVLLLLLVAPCTVGMSLLLAGWVEAPIDRIRHRFRTRAA